MRKIVRIFVLVMSLPCLGLLIAVAIDSYLDKKRDLIVFDNRLETPASVYADGTEVKKIGPHQSYGAVVTIPPGAKHLEVRAGGKVVSGVDLALHPNPQEKGGYRGLYVVGPTRRYVIAKVPYYEKMPSPPVYATKTLVPLPSPLAELPRDVQSFEMHVDGVFLNSENVPGGTEVYWKRQICSLTDDEDEGATVNCQGYPSR